MLFLFNVQLRNKYDDDDDDDRVCLFSCLCVVRTTQNLLTDSNDGPVDGEEITIFLNLLYLLTLLILFLSYYKCHTIEGKQKNNVIVQIQYASF